MSKPLALAPASAPLTTTIGLLGEARLGGAVDEDRGGDGRQGRSGLIVCTPEPGMSKVIVVTKPVTGSALESGSCRSEPGPLSLVFVTTKILRRREEGRHRGRELRGVAGGFIGCRRRHQLPGWAADPGT